MNIKNRSSKITAELVIPAARANGVILSQGGRFGGWSLYMRDGRPAYTYNFLGLERYTVASPQALPPGPVTVTLDFVYDGGGVGKGGKATLLVNGKAVAEGRVEKTQPNIFSADETADVGIDNQTPVANGHRHRRGNAVHRPDQQDHPRGETDGIGRQPTWTTQPGARRLTVTTRGRSAEGVCDGSKSSHVHGGGLLYGRDSLHRPAAGGASVGDDGGDPLRGRRAHPGHGLAARRPPGSRAARDGHAVHRGLRRDGQAPRDSRGRDVQPHALFHRQGAGARVDVRGAQVIRERSEHGSQDGQSQSACGDRADVARSAGVHPS